VNTVAASSPYRNLHPVTRRGRYQGVLQILKFNWSIYLASAAAIGVAWFAAAFLPAAPGFCAALRAAALLGSALALMWMVSSLLVSHYVYDRSSLYDLDWLARALSRVPRRWINIHSGWDETSSLLTEIFPRAVGEAVDLFDPAVMTEVSIRRARRASPPQAKRGVPATPARYDALPFENAVADTVFAIFAAHELRRHHQRVRLFTEIQRILTAGGEFVLVEHVRDWRNFLAFGPGFLHFFSPRQWRKAAACAGLSVHSQFQVTPFVNVSILRRNR